MGFLLPLKIIILMLIVGLNNSVCIANSNPKSTEVEDFKSETIINLSLLNKNQQQKVDSCMPIGWGEIKFPKISEISYLQIIRENNLWQIVCFTKTKSKNYTKEIKEGIFDDKFFLKLRYPHISFFPARKSYEKMGALSRWEKVAYCNMNVPFFIKNGGRYKFKWLSENSCLFILYDVETKDFSGNPIPVLKQKDDAYFISHKWVGSKQYGFGSTYGGDEGEILCKISNNTLEIEEERFCKSKINKLHPLYYKDMYLATYTMNFVLCQHSILDDTVKDLMVASKNTTSSFSPKKLSIHSTISIDELIKGFEKFEIRNIKK